MILQRTVPEKWYFHDFISQARKNKEETTPKGITQYFLYLTKKFLGCYLIIEMKNCFIATKNLESTSNNIYLISILKLLASVALTICLDFYLPSVNTYKCQFLMILFWRKKNLSTASGSLLNVLQLLDGKGKFLYAIFTINWGREVLRIHAFCGRHL